MAAASGRLGASVGALRGGLGLGLGAARSHAAGLHILSASRLNNSVLQRMLAKFRFAFTPLSSEGNQALTRQKQRLAEALRGFKAAATVGPQGQVICQCKSYDM